MDISSQFQKQGFLQGIPVLSAHQALKIRQHVESVEQEHPEMITNNDISNAPWSAPHHPLQRIFQSLARHPAITKVVSQLIGPNLLIRNGDIFIKNPEGILKIGWHVDTPFAWPASRGMINCWLGLTSTSPFQGGLYYIPQSHTHIFQQEPRSKNTLSLTEEQLSELDLPSAIPSIMSTGQLAVHSFRTVHSSAVNKSPNRRIGIVLRFISAQTRPEIAEANQAFLVQGSPGRWKKRLRPYFPISWSIK